MGFFLSNSTENVLAVQFPSLLYLFLICILTAKNKWYFSLSVHSFQLSVNAGHLGESKQISLHFFPPPTAYCYLLQVIFQLARY